MNVKEDAKASAGVVVTGQEIVATRGDGLSFDADAQDSQPLLEVVRQLRLKNSGPESPRPSG